MEKNNIFIISDSESQAKNFISKILLLRKSDLIGILNYSHSFDVLKKQSPDLVLFHVKNYKDAEKIAEYRELPSLKSSVFIMLSEFEDSDLLCKAFDSGIDDFMNINVDETTLIMRIMWALKKKRGVELSNRNADILSFLSVTEKNTGFFQKNHTQKVFGKEYKRLFENDEKAVLMVVTADIAYKSKLPILQLGKIIKSVVRSNDTVGFAPDDKIYLILPQTDKDGAEKFYNRIVEKLDGVTISATATENLMSDFAEVEKVLNKQLARALTTSEKFIFVSEEINKSSNFAIKEQDKKLSKGAFLKRLEKIVTPTFFKMQAIYEPKLFDTKISQICNDKEMTFVVSGRELSSKLTIKFEEYPTVTFETIDVCRGSSNREKYKLDIDELTVEYLENIMQSELEAYRTNLYEDEEEIL